MRRFVPLLLGFLVAAGAATVPAAAARPEGGQRLLVQADPDVLREHGLRPGRRLGRSGFTAVEVASASAMAALAADPRVGAVEVDRVRRMSATPNDTHWAAQNELTRVRLPEAWDVAKAPSSLVVAVVDTGVDLDHPDLLGHFVAGYDFVANDLLPDDRNGHGTMVAGIAAANTNNNRGVAGASWGASIMPLRVLDENGEGFDSDIAAAIEHAVDNGADVVNLSLGGPGTTTALTAALDYAAAEDVVVVAAAGNDGNGVVQYPAAHPSVLAVGATDVNGDLVYFSQHGPWVDIAAPGVNVTSTEWNTPERYTAGHGTSFAAPIVSGAAALVRTWQPTWTAAQVVDRLQSTAQDNGPTGKDDSYGWGVLDAAAAVGVVPSAAIPPEGGDAHEPNDTSGAATLVASSATASVSPEGDDDWYAVDVPAAGNVTVTVTPEADNSSWQAMDPAVTLVSPSGSTVATVDAAKEDEAEELTASVPAAGRYRILVANVNGGRSPGTYALSVVVPAAPPPTTTTTAPPAELPRSDGPARSGYWMVDSRGYVYAFGDAGHFGGANGARTDVVDLEPTPTGNGYWLVTSQGEVFAYGDARLLGRGTVPAGEAVTSMSAHPGGAGYWLFTSRGRVIAVDGAPHKGDMSGASLNGPVLDSVATPSGDGYYMVASDGGIFAFGDARFRGSMGGHRLNAPVQSLVPDGDNDGYWLVASDGGIFAFSAAFRGSMGAAPLNRPVTGMVRFGDGYLMVGEDGGIFNFSSKPFHGSLGANPPPQPVVAVAALG